MTKNETDQDPTPPAPRSPAAAAPAAAAATIADGRDDYTVTAIAGPKVAGQRVTKGDHLRLTPDEARSDLSTGAIVRKGERLHEMFTRKGPSKAA